MGKGKRNSQKRTEEINQNSEMYLEKQKNETKKSHADKTIGIVCAVFALLIALILVFNVIVDNGVFLRSKDAAKTENVEVDAAMMSFFLNQYIIDWYSNDYMTLYYNLYLNNKVLDLDLSKSFREQTISKDVATYLGTQYEGSTWYDYFVSAVMEQVDMYVIYANAAIADGLTLSKEDKAEIEETVKTINDTILTEGSSYAARYGQGVKKSDVRNCYELIWLASNYAEYKQEQLENALEADDSAVHTYVDENKGSFYSAEVLSYDISVSSKDFANDAAYDLAVQLAKESADKIAAAKTPAEFVEFVEAYEKENRINTEADESETGSESETLSPEEELESKIEELKSTINYQTGDDELYAWLFGEAPAEEGDVKVIEEIETTTKKAETEAATESASESETESATEAGEPAAQSDETDTETDAASEAASESESASEAETETVEATADVDEVFTVTVYLVTRPNGLDKTLTHDFAYLVVNEKEIAEDFLASFKAGEMNSDRFYDLAEEKYNAIHSDKDHEHSDSEMFEYNSLEKQGEGVFNATYAVLNDWVEADDIANNTVSDIIEIQVDDETVQYGVIYFAQHGDELWYANAFSTVVAEQLEEWYNSTLEDMKENGSYVVNNAVISDIGTVQWGSSTSTDDHEGHDH